MIKSFREIDNYLSEEVCNTFEESFDFDLLRKKYPTLDYNVLYSILYSKEKYGKKLYKCIWQENINENKILIISDTHNGSIYENIKYIDDTFDFAAKEGIKTILHGGDILEAQVKNK